MSRSVIELADEKVSIAQVCAWVGVDLPDGHYGKSWKAYCPFGEFWHPDFGSSKSFRIYGDTNAAWCFAGCGRFGPTSLFAKFQGVSFKAAARELLDRVGYRPPSLEERWKQATEVEDTPNTLWLGVALKTYCERVAGPRWNLMQLDTEISGMLDKCLSLLELVKTSEDSIKWMKATKSAMNKALEGNTK